MFLKWNFWSLTPEKKIFFSSLICLMRKAKAAVTGFLLKRGSVKFLKTHSKTHVSESLFNKVVGCRPATFLEIPSDTRVFL